MALTRDRLERWLPFLAWPRPDRALLVNEAAAGLTVALMVIPQGVAYAALAGMPLVTGVYAALLPALVALLFSSSARLSVGPRPGQEGKPALESVAGQGHGRGPRKMEECTGR